MKSVRSSETFVSLHRTTRSHVSEDSKIQEARSRPARTAVTTKAGCPCSLPTFRDIPFSGIRCPITVCYILKGSDDLRTFEDDGNAFLRTFGQHLPCDTDSHPVTADSSTTPPWRPQSSKSWYVSYLRYRYAATFLSTANRQVEGPLLVGFLSLLVQQVHLSWTSENVPCVCDKEPLNPASAYST